MKKKVMMFIVGVIALVTGFSSPSIAKPEIVQSPETLPKPLVETTVGIAISDNLQRTSDRWAKEDADDIIAVLPVDGRVTVLVSGGKENAEAIKKQLPATQARVTDVVPGGLLYAVGPSQDDGEWSAGAWINTSVRCTEGFAWRSWVTGRVRGSTARHCGWGRWWNDGRHVGSVLRQGTGSNDVQLLGAAPGTKFDTNVWVRTKSGLKLKRVSDAGQNVIGTNVSFYGRKSGGGWGRIVSKRVNGQKGLVLTTASQVRPGDSGGPVFVTKSDGTIEARGTVSSLAYADLNANGRFDSNDKITGMVFTDITYSSTNLRASVRIKR